MIVIAWISRGYERDAPSSEDAAFYNRSNLLNFLRLRPLTLPPRSRHMDYKTIFARVKT
jgi:hypothetical protein